MINNLYNIGIYTIVHFTEYTIAIGGNLLVTYINLLIGYAIFKSESDPGT